MAGNMNFISRSCSCSCSFRLFSKSNNDQESNFRSQSFSQDSFNSSFSSKSSLPPSQDSFNSSFSSKSSLPPSISAVIPPSTTTLHHHCISTFNPNSTNILSLTLTGSHLISGSSTQIHLFPRHPTTTTTKFISISCNSAVKSLQILNENTLITSHQDHKIRIWNINKLKLITTLPTLPDRLTKILFAKNYVEIRRHKKLTWIHHNDAVSSLAVSTNKSLIYSASWDRSFKVWRSSDFKCLESISNAHDDAINAIVVSNEGFVYTGSADKKIKVWRRKNRGDRKHYIIEKMEHHKSAVNALGYDDEVSVLISGACSGVLIASERNSDGDGGHMVVVAALLGHKKAILCVRILGELVCSGSADKTVRLWRRSVGKLRYSCLGVLEGHGGPVKCLTMAEERCEEEEEEEGRGYMVYSGSLDSEIKVWKVWVPFIMEKEEEEASLANFDA